MKSKHRKLLETIFARPTRAGIIFSDIEKLIIALDADVREGDGSRVVFELCGIRKYLHRPHPGKEAKKYQVEDIWSWLEHLGVTP